MKNQEFLCSCDVLRIQTLHTPLFNKTLTYFKTSTGPVLYKVYLATICVLNPFDFVPSGCPTRSPSKRYCPARNFPCNNTLCVHKMWVCDGEDDCGDGSDEATELCGKPFLMPCVSKYSGSSCKRLRQDFWKSSRDVNSRKLPPLRR